MERKVPSEGGPNLRADLDRGGPYPLEDLDRGSPNLGSYIAVVAARWTKSLKFTLSIAVHRGGLTKNLFFFSTPKKRIGEQLNYF